MNKLILSLAAALLAVTLRADGTNTAPVTAEEVITEALNVIQSEGWTAADVADAIKSVRGLYVRDNATKEGRQRWNGKIVSTTIDTNALTRTTVYENGRTFVDQAAVASPAASVAKANKRLTTVVSNGVPVALAAARARRASEIDNGPSNVTVSVTAGE